MRLDELRRQANGGDVQAQAEIRRFLDENPSVWRQIGDLGKHAELNLVRLVAEGEFLLGEAIQRKAAEMRRDLLSPFPSALEIILVERIVATWLHLQWVEMQCSRSLGESTAANLWLQRRSQADRLYQAAVKSLLLVRELLPAEVQPDLAAGANDAPTRGSRAKSNGHVAASSGAKATANAPVNRIAAVSSGKRRQLQTT
ncbi:MAG: hypothetical protein ACLQNE_20175 [Thermoguttaceae bacterium]